MKNLLLILFFVSIPSFGQQTINKLITKELTVQDYINVTSTTKSSKPCPPMTLVQRDAITTPATGSCVYNTTDLELNVYDGTAWQSAGGGGINNWETAKSYDVDDVVIESNKIYQCENAHTSGTFATDLANGDWVEISAVPYESTGLISGGILSIDTDNTKFDLASHVVAFTGDTASISCPALDAQTVTNLAGADITYILVDDTCAVTQQTAFPAPQEQRAKAFIGRINHPNRTNIQSAYNSPNFLISTNTQLYDLYDSIGPFNKSGNVITPNGANLSIDRSAGVIFRRGSNYSTDSNNPHERSFTAATVANLFRSTQLAIGTTLYTTIDPANYDNAGTITAVGGLGGRSTNQRVYLLASGNLAVQYGQVIYNNLANAVAGIPNESFTPNQGIVESGVLIGVISCRRDATDASNTAQCVFSKVSRFDSSGVSVGSNSVATLQTAYSNSSQPQITTDTTLGAIQFKRGTLNDSDVVAEVLNGAGTSKFSVTGEGVISAASATLTGSITATNIAGTNTGDLVSETSAGFLTATTKILEVPNNQLIVTNAGTGKNRISTGNNNELINEAFESVTVSEGWTVSNATASAETTNEFEGFKTLSLSLTGALSLSQSSTINAARKLGVQMVASLWVKSDDVSDLQLCSLKNGAEDKCTVTGGYVQGSGWRQLTVSFLGDSTSNGLKLKSTDTTGTVLVDQAFVGVGSPLVDFTPDMVYSAKISATGGILSQNTDFIASCTNANPIVCAFKPNEFTVAPVCSAVIDYGGAGAVTVRASSISSSSVSFERFDLNAAISNGGVMVVCQKQGADYKTSKAYVASSSDYDWVAYTPTSPNGSFGTITGTECLQKREGSDLLVRCKFTSGTTVGSEARISLPSGLTSASTDKIPSLSRVGSASTGSAAATYFHNSVLIEPSVTYFTFGHQSSTGSSVAKANGNTVVGNSTLVSFYARIPIQGWTDSGVIVGSFQGYNETPGTSRVETFSFSYGTTNATTACTASPCSYLDQIGNNVTSVTRGGAGSYTANLGKTYLKAKCSIESNSPSGNGVSGSIRCENCNSISFYTVNANVGGLPFFDTFGTLICQGIPQ